MSRSIQFCFFFVLLLLATKSLAQNTMTKRIDSLYREDQFFVGVTYNLVTNVPGDVNIRGLSGGFQFGYLRDMPINKRRNIAIAIGAGLTFDRYGQTLFIGENNSEETIFTILTNDIDYDSNRFSTATIEAPIEFRWRTSTPETYKFWRIHAGFRVGYAYWYQSTFKQPNNNVTQTNISEFDRVRLGATLAFGYNTFTFYAYYSINPFFTDAITTSGQTVDFRTLKVGLLFYML